MEHTPDPMLVNITWEWMQRDPNGNQIDEITVPNPENYTLLFYRNHYRFADDRAFYMKVRNLARRLPLFPLKHEQVPDYFMLVFERRG